MPTDKHHGSTEHDEPFEEGKENSHNQTDPSAFARLRSSHASKY